MKKFTLLLCACVMSLSSAAFAADTTPDATTAATQPAVATAPTATTGVLPKEPCTGAPDRYDLKDYVLASTEGHAVHKQIAVSDMIFSKDVTPIVINNTLLVPARAVANGLGFTTTWDASGAVPTITIASKTMTTTLTLGEDLSTASSTVAIGTTAPISYGAPAVLVGNTAYVPVDVFRVLQGNNPAAVTITDQAVIIKNV